MKNTDIAKIRQLLKKIHRWTIEESGIVCPHKFGVCKHDNKKCPVYLIEEVLALLPCETCIDGKIPKVIDGHIITPDDIPCPDCQQPPP